MADELTIEQQAIRDKAIKFAKQHRKNFSKNFTDKLIYPSESNPVSVFMAGSPGAGKTEASKALIAQFDDSIIRIDPDEFRTEFEDYTGDNSWLFQPAVSLIVERIHDLVLKQKQSFILDGTLTNHTKAEHNIARSLRKGRTVQILYVYQEPERAWEFVKARELVEGRNIPKARFIAQYFEARDSVNRLKRHFDGDIKVDLLLQNHDNTHQLYKANIEDIDNHLSEKYTAAELEKLLCER